MKVALSMTTLPPATNLPLPSRARLFRPLPSLLGSRTVTPSVPKPEVPARKVGLAVSAMRPDRPLAPFPETSSTIWSESARRVSVPEPPSTVHIPAWPPQMIVSLPAPAQGGDVRGGGIHGHQHIVAVPADEGVVAAVPVDDVVPGIAGQGIGVD